MSSIGTSTERASAAAAQADDRPIAVSYHQVGRTFTTAKRTFTAVQGIDLEIRKGEFICIIGPSGCGKSTLLNMAAGLLTQSTGEVLYDGKPINGINNDVGYVTQKDTLLPWRTVEKNVSLPLEVQKVPRRERKERVAQVLDLVGLGQYGNRYPSQLSGGMLKRAALAQTLVYRPNTLLMDEPFGALDAQLRLNLQRQTLEIWERERKTVLFVTHDLEEAILMADRVVVFGANPGRIIHVEPITFARPRDFGSLRTDPEFAAVWSRLWALLSPQMEDH
ncbi:ABC transporter ATP-binding protein [Nonomuraea sp. NPDC049486]|uniref:ABC transporter ATP-binding protein n=1 Tax=Nonomuraea harbinensis TaxID=1286938 RepID=A0ABW1C7M0_9ACTN|nr:MULTISPECIES: ABC transporter ATP-binding protein [Nonomuraea]TXK40264.1 ABC transporter ATP-binding protein [Nonomuraea sp. C10]